MTDLERRAREKAEHALEDAIDALPDDCVRKLIPPTEWNAAADRIAAALVAFAREHGERVARRCLPLVADGLGGFLYDEEQIKAALAAAEETK